MEKATKLFIKGMVCNRCMMVIKNELESLGHSPVQIELGVVKIARPEDEIDRTEMERRLTPLGFDLLEDRNEKLVREVKALVHEVYSGEFDFPERFRFTAFARERLSKDYDSVSDVFIALEKKTIEQFMIEFRIDKVKEYLVYSNHTLSEIAFRLNFNSTAHLSAQFKQQTGLTASYFKAIKRQKVEMIFSWS
ncbi:MAG TPA: AraC family transcriptional regulator [Flavisolibacter sp.]|nr:AraC family transcriptional regulator [Flavisolibacter sp.]